MTQSGKQRSVMTNLHSAVAELVKATFPSVSDEQCQDFAEQIHSTYRLVIQSEVEHQSKISEERRRRRDESPN
jgi:hypothetical protein